MIEDYTRERLDRIGEDVAITRTKVEAMERSFSGILAETNDQEQRLMRLERRVFALWLIGPALVGAALFFQQFRGWLMER